MNPLPTRYALLRDRRHWDGAASGLVFDVDGVASLMPVPNPPAKVALAGPYGVLPSGLACAGCDSRFIADTAHQQLIYVDGPCAAQARIGQAQGGAGIGEFDTPRGIVFAPGRGLYVADSGNARIVLLADPTLATVAIWTAGLTAPQALALDSVQRLYVVDGAAGRILRFLPDGSPDTAYDGAMALAMAGLAARFIAVGDDDVLHVATATGRLLRCDPDGTALPALAELDAALSGGALALGPGLIYVADTASGAIAVLENGAGATLATIPHFAGPVSALALCADGVLLVKTGDDDAVIACPPTAVASAGKLEAGPFDAGDKDAWYVAVAEAEVAPDAGLALALYASDDATAAPAPADWVAAPASSVLVANLFPAVAARFLWLRVTLRSADNLATPRLSQVRAETPGEDYLDQLPAIYRNTDVGESFLGRMLAALRVQFDRSERVIDSLALRLSIDFAPLAELAWIASWLGFELPAGLPGPGQRALLHRVVKLYDRRWTPAGIAELVHVYTGVRPRIVEAWRERRLWQLGIDSSLGFDTGLAPGDPAGMIVPEPALPGGVAPGCDCADPARLTIGSTVVGASGPLARDDFGAPLFTDAAHRFIVSVPAYQAPHLSVRDAIRRVIEREKPAHTDYVLCFIEPEMRVGLQAMLGIDTYVAAQPAAASLAGMTLGLDAYLAGADAGHVSSHGRLGLDTRLA
jgi:phage tail-like protein